MLIWSIFDVTNPPVKEPKVPPKKDTPIPPKNCAIVVPVAMQASTALEIKLPPIPANAPDIAPVIIPPQYPALNEPPVVSFKYPVIKELAPAETTAPLDRTRF